MLIVASTDLLQQVQSNFILHYLVLIVFLSPVTVFLVTRW